MLLCTILGTRSHLPAQGMFESMIFLLSRFGGIYVILPWTALYHFFPTVVSGVIFFTRRQGKGVAITKAKLKNLLTGAIIEKTSLACIRFENQPSVDWLEGI